jgi:hypothetical protein
MSTKRALIPFTQSRFLFSEKQQRIKETTKTLIKSSGTVYSEEVYAPSEHGFGSVLIHAIYTEAVPNGGVAMTIKVSYKFPGTSNWSTGVTLATLTGQTGTKVHTYRLDATLGINWIPNTTMRYEFSIPSGSDADQVVLKGRHIV